MMKARKIDLLVMVASKHTDKSHCWWRASETSWELINLAGIRHRYAILQIASGNIQQEEKKRKLPEKNKKTNM